jgi:acetyl-CoA carboxylase carboxyltransferase component
VLAHDDRAGIGGTFIFTFRQGEDGGFTEERTYRGLHPMVGKRLQIWRLQNFEVRRLPSVEDVYVFHGTARDNPKDERLVAFAEVRDLSAVRDARGRLTALPVLERMLMEALATIRAEQSGRDPRRRLQKNRVYLHVTPVVDLSSDDFGALVRKLAPATEGLGMEAVRVHAEMRVAKGETRPTVIDIANLDGTGASLAFKPPHDIPLIPLEPYQQKVVWARSRGLVYPYEIVKRLAPSAEAALGPIPQGEFVEYDLDETGRRLAPIQRPFGENRAGVVVGVIRSFTDRYPEGMTRVIVLSDATRAMGALKEPECRRLVAALDLAEQLGAPVEWFAVSSGAAIAMDTGTENLDWTARVLRRIVEHTRAGHEINVVVCGINVGAQSYWNAEATMLMHCRGTLIMASSGAMVLTGERALRYSGGVSAPSNRGIGGYDLIMGPNGQAQYWARDVSEACHLLMRYYEHAFVAPGERFPRKAPTDDPIDRDVRAFPHGREDGVEFLTVGQIFDDASNPGRKRPFAIRRVMAAVCDRDHPTLERWRDFQEAEMAVVIDAHLGGRPVCLIGIESKPLPREGYLPTDGPERWTAGTLFPRSSKKVARAINACSGSRPVVVLANLSGFDGSPESMRELQLEYGAEIGRAVVRFDGPIVFCVISRYHGGAYVVFSNALNEGLEVAALEGAYASVIGGAPAAAVVFAREVRARTRADRRVQEAEARLARAPEGDRPRRRRELEAVTARVHSEKLGEIADEFDAVHTVERAKAVGSLDAVIASERLRPYLIEAVERGVGRLEGELGE